MLDILLISNDPKVRADLEAYCKKTFVDPDGEELVQLLFPPLPDLAIENAGLIVVHLESLDPVDIPGQVAKYQRMQRNKLTVLVSTTKGPRSLAQALDEPFVESLFSVIPAREDWLEQIGKEAGFAFLTLFGDPKSMANFANEHNLPIEEHHAEAFKSYRSGG